MIIIRRLCLSFLVIAVFTAAAPPEKQSNKPSVHVLCYHGFVDKKNVDLYFSIDELRSHIQWLKDRGYRFISMEDFASGRVRGQNNVLVTVDDGNKSVYPAWEQVFRPNGIRPVLAIYPNIISRKPFALTWEQVKRLSDAGCTIAAHGFYHEKINQKLYDTRRKDFLNEIYGSKRVLEEKTGRKVDVFVYPFGVKSPITVKTLKEAGYRYSFTIEQGGIDFPVQPKYNPLELPRYMMAKSNWKSLLGLIAKNKIHRGMKASVASVVDSKSSAEKKKDPADPQDVKKNERKESGDKKPAKIGNDGKKDTHVAVKGADAKKEGAGAAGKGRGTAKKSGPAMDRKTAAGGAEKKTTPRIKDQTGKNLGKIGVVAAAGSRGATRDGELEVLPRWREAVSEKRTDKKPVKTDGRLRDISPDEMADTPAKGASLREGPDDRGRDTGKKTAPGKIKLGFMNSAAHTGREYSRIMDRVTVKFGKFRDLLKAKK